MGWICKCGSTNYVEKGDVYEYKTLAEDGNVDITDTDYGDDWHIYCSGCDDTVDVEYDEELLSKDDLKLLFSVEGKKRFIRMALIMQREKKLSEEKAEWVRIIKDFLEDNVNEKDLIDKIEIEKEMVVNMI